MANQTKSYRKFVATAATATLVASALAPVASAAVVSADNFTDVADNYKEAVKYLVDNGITQGKSATQFGTHDNIIRADAAMWIAKAVLTEEEIDNAERSGFTDVPDRARKYVDALKENDILNGISTTQFGSDNLIKRGDVARILAAAYNLEGDVDNVTFTDVAPQYKAAVAALLDNGITNGKKNNRFGTDDSITRGELAIWVQRLGELEAEEEVDAEVVSVNAANATTLSLTGKGLNNLKVEDITVQNNSVITINASEDGKTATVTLGAALVPDTEYKVTVNANEGTKDFTVKYNLQVTKVSVDAKKYDDDTANQYVSFKVNGLEANVTDLRVNGYSVQFSAVDKDGKNADAIFADATTGKLVDLLNAGDVYKVQVTLSKGSDVYVSEQAEIKIENFELIASAIDSYELLNSEGFKQKSSTLVATETATFNELVAIQNGKKTELKAGDIATAIADGLLEIESSNPAVVSVDDNELTANTPGTATITITYGSVTKKFSLTVAQGERKAAKATPEKNSLTTVLSSSTANNEVKYTVVDQYGDPVNAETLTVEETDKTVAKASVTATDVDGEATLTVSPEKVGNTAIVLKNEDGKTIGSIAVKVTDNATAAKTVLEIIKPTKAEIDAGQSEDTTLDYADEVNVKFQLQPYTAENVKLAPKDLTGYTVKFDKSIVTVNDDKTGEVELGAETEELDITFADKLKLGYSDIVLYDDENVKVGQVRVTVVDNTPEIKSVGFKSVPAVNYAGKKIDYTTVLNITESNNNDIVKGITLTKPVSSVIRIDNTGVLYIDKNGDGILNKTDQGEAQEVVLGTLGMAPVSGSKGFADFIGKDIMTGGTTAAGDKGTLVITVKNDEDKILASSSITVNVPGTPAETSGEEGQD